MPINPAIMALCGTRWSSLEDDMLLEVLRSIPKNVYRPNQWIDWGVVSTQMGNEMTRCYGDRHRIYTMGSCQGRYAALKKMGRAILDGNGNKVQGEGENRNGSHSQGKQIMGPPPRPTQAATAMHTEHHNYRYNTIAFTPSRNQPEPTHAGPSAAGVFEEPMGAGFDGIFNHSEEEVDRAILELQQWQKGYMREQGTRWGFTGSNDHV